MVGAPAAADAIARAKRLPNLRVGLHVTVADGRALLPPHEIPQPQRRRDGNLPTNLVSAPACTGSSRRERGAT